MKRLTEAEKLARIVPSKYDDPAERAARAEYAMSQIRCGAVIDWDEDDE